MSWARRGLDWDRGGYQPYGPSIEDCVPPTGGTGVAPPKPVRHDWVCRHVHFVEFSLHCAQLEEKGYEIRAVLPAARELGIDYCRIIAAKPLASE